MRATRSWLGRVLVALLGLGILLALVMLLSDLLERNFLESLVAGEVGTRVMDDMAAEHEMRQGILGLLSFALGCVTGIMALVWIYRAHLAARRDESRSISVSPGWAVGWFFVPIANLWKPYHAMWQLWRYQHPTGGRMLLRCWWALWLASSVVGIPNVVAPPPPSHHPASTS